MYYTLHSTLLSGLLDSRIEGTSCEIKEEEGSMSPEEWGFSMDLLEETFFSRDFIDWFILCLASIRIDDPHVVVEH